MRDFIRKNSVFFILSIFISIYFELYREMRTQFLTGQYVGLLNNEFNVKMIIKISLFFVVALAILLLINHFKHIFTYIDKYRYFISLGIIIICTIFELSGSSVAAYYTYLGNSYQNTSDLISQGVLSGIPRAIRSDEWATLTPLNFSQEYNSYNSISQIIRGTATDVTTLYANPSFSVATLFRPFQWGYLLLGSAKGLAFYWASRTVCLFLVSYEFGKLLTNNKKVLSVSFAALITFSQTIQWWYSTNGLIEMFLFGELEIILLYTLVHTDILWHKFLICLGIIECAGGYLLAYYPAQQIPLGYVFFALALWIIVNNRTLFKKVDIFLILGSILVFTVIISIVIYQSWDTIQTSLNTVYPGKRTNTGGESKLTYLFYWIISIFTPIEDNRLIEDTSLIVNKNACESSMFYSIFPLGIICSVYSMIKKRRANLLYILLIAIELLFIIYCVAGFPIILAKISLLSYSISNRVLEIMGFIDIIILFRFLSEKENNANSTSTTTNIIKFFVGIIGTLIIVQLLYYYGCNTSLAIWFTTIITTLWIIYLIIKNTPEHKNKLAITLLCVVTISGLCVNPIQKGTDTITNSDAVTSIKDIVNNEPEALWVVITDPYRFAQNNIPITAGARTINSTNTYPCLDTWKKIDPDEKYSEIYNRYAHITADITDDITSFSLIQYDYFKVNISQNDLHKLNISYILSDKTLNANNIKLIKETNSMYIYKVT